MNFLNILKQIEGIDPYVQERMNNRRDLIKNFLKVGSKLSLAAVPVALGGLLNRAYGQVPGKIVDVLQFALTLEHLESRFYQTAMSKQNLIPAKGKINVIRDHEMEHVKFLQETIKSTGNTPIGEGQYDFTAKGLYPNVFNDYKEFLLVAQSLEDTGVGAYKGQAEELKDNDEILTSALRIHSMEARHAGHIRMIRMINGYAKIKAWIIGDDNTKGTPQERIYKRESDHRQVLINIDGIGGFNTGMQAQQVLMNPCIKMK